LPRLCFQLVRRRSLNWHVSRYVQVSVSDADPFPTLCMSVCPLNPTMWSLTSFGPSGRCLAASTGEFGIFEPFRRVLTLSVSFSAVFVLSATLCASVGFPKVFGPSGRSGLAALIGESGSLVFFRDVLMFSGEFVGFIVSVSTLGTSPVPAQRVRLAPKAICLDSAAFRVSNAQYAPAPSPQLISTVSGLFDVFDASA